MRVHTLEVSVLFVLLVFPHPSRAQQESVHRATDSSGGITISTYDSKGQLASTTNGTGNTKYLAGVVASAPTSTQKVRTQSAQPPAPGGLAAPPTWLSASHTVENHSAYRRPPILFEANAGQVPAEVKLLARRSAFTLFLASGESVLALKQAGATTVLRMQLLGANRKAEVVGLDLVAGRSNYFVGKVPSAWVTDVPNYTRAEYRGIYPDTNLVFHGEDGAIEYDFRLAPRADPRAIRISFPGAEKMEIDRNGDLLLHAGGTILRQRRPIAYQNGALGRREIAANYVLVDSSAVRFNLGHYDGDKELVIDPVLTYSTYLGGNGDDGASAIAVDAQGNAYITGQTLSTDFPLKNAFQSSCGGNCLAGSADVFVTKISPDGKSLIYSTYLGGNSLDQGLGIAVDPNGNAYVTGMTSSADFPVTSNAFQKLCQSHACGSGFVTKLNAAGNALVFSTYLGGSYPFDQGNAIAVDQNGNAYVAGMTTSIDFPTTPGAFSTKCGTDGMCNSLISDAFVTKLSADGSSLVFSTFLGGSSGDWAKGIAVDSLGSAYVVGTTFSSDFPTTLGAPQQKIGGFTDAFVTKFHPDGSSLDYSTFLGGGSYDYGRAIAVDSSLNAYVTGDTSSVDFPTVPGSFQTGSPGAPDAFVTKFTPSGHGMVYSTYLGGVLQDTGAAIALNSTGNAYITGTTSSANFPTSSPIQATCKPCPQFENVYVTKLTADGSKAVFSTFLGGSFNDAGAGIAVDSNGDAYVAGYAISSDFPTTPGAFQTARAAPGDTFIANISNLKLPVVTLPTPFVNFPVPQLVRTTSPQAQVIMLKNVGDGALTISSASTSGDFSETDDCGASVPGLGACALTFTFTPTAIGPRFGTFTINDNAADSPQIVSLMGTGVAPIVMLGRTSISFSDHIVGSTSGVQMVSLSNTGTAPLTISSMAITGANHGDFSQTNTCGGSVAIGANCTISFTFTPAALGSRTASLQISDDALDTPQSISLSGVGTGPAGDFDGDGKTDVAVFRPSNGTWFVIPSSTPTNFRVQQWGTSGDIPLQGDYDGDGLTDVAVWRASNGTWFIIPSSNPSAPIVQQWGTVGDIPVPGDYDGDGKTDFAVFRPSNGTWFIIPSSNPSAPIVQQWGTVGDIPVPGDYDGDGKTDFAVWRPSNGTWFIIPSSNPSAPIIQQWGTVGDIPVPGDYDGDGKADFAVFRPSTGTWFIIPSSNPSAPILRQWGTQGDIPVPVDYDGDRKTDIAVWRPSNGVWFVIPSSAPSTFTMTQWGANGDVPVQKLIGQ